MKLKEALRVQIHACTVYKYLCHCACSPEIGTCIINDAGRQAEQNKNKNTHKKIIKYENSRILIESRHTTFYNHTLRVNINIERKRKKKFSKQLPNSTTIYL